MTDPIKVDYIICPRCGLPVEVKGGAPDTSHDCMASLKLEVFRLRQKIADTWG